MTNLKKFAVTYEIDYTHRVVVGVTAPDAEAAKKLASRAFDEGSIWDDTEKMPLLYDDYEEVASETLRFSAEEVPEFPKPDPSVTALKQKEFAYYACQALLFGKIESARDFAIKALPNITAALSSQRDAAQSILLDGPLLTSTEVIGLAKDYGLKFSMSLAGGFRAKHYLSSNHGDQYFHEGIDGVAREIYPEELLKIYPESLGKIWRIDEKISNKPIPHAPVAIYELLTVQ